MSVNAATLAEVQRKAGLGIPLSNQSNAANNAAYASAVQANKQKAASQAQQPPVMSQAQTDSLIAGARAGMAQYQATGSFSDKTPAQNLAAVINQDGNTVKNDPAKQTFIQNTLAQAQKDSQAAAGGNTGGTITGGTTGGGTGGTGTGSTDTTSQNYINQLEQYRQQSAIAALQKSRDTSLSNLSAESAKIAPQYYADRNTAAAGGQQQARNFAEYMANRGGTSAGSNIQATLMNNFQTQGQIGNLNTQEQAANNDIARRTTDINNGYNSDVASATATAEGDKMQALLTDYYSAQQRGDTQAQNDIKNKLAQAQFDQTTNQDNITNTRNAANDAISNAKDMATLTGYMSDGKGGFVPTNAKQQQDLTNAWTATTNLGTVTKALSDLTGIPVGTPTQVAKNEAIQNGISQQNSTNSKNNMAADNARQDNAVKLTADQNDFTSQVYDQLSKLDPSDAAAYLNQNSALIVKTLGQKGYDSLKASATSGQATIDKNAAAAAKIKSDADKAKKDLRDKAIAAAQKDPAYLGGKKTLAQLIPDYEALYN